MIEILDEIEIPRTKKINSKLSLIFTLITLVFAIIDVIILRSLQEAKNLFPPSLLIQIAFAIPKITCVLGFIFTILSFRKREKPNKLRLIGAIFYTVLFLVLIAMIISNISDVQKVYKGDSR